MRYLILCFKAAVIIIFSIIFSVKSVYANPGFARRYGVSCAVCHKAFPKLNEFGEMFVGNGYQMPEEEPGDTSVQTGDDILNLMKNIPISMRIDSYLNWRQDSDTNYDMKAPFGFKLLSSAVLMKDISYYFYYYMSERGEVAGIEDAFIYFNNIIKDEDIDFMIGQFSVTDSIFARETRLTREDYHIYKTKISNSEFDLTYDRGATLSYSKSVTDFTVGVVNGNGIGKADDKRNFDSDNYKNYFGRVGGELFNASVGFFGYSGREKDIRGSGSINEFYRIGPDVNIDVLDNVNIYSSWLWGKDNNPDFSTSGKNEVRVNGGFVGMEILVNQRWMINILYNRVYSREMPSKNLDLLTANISFYKLRNFKIIAEYTYDLREKDKVHTERNNSLSIGIVTAF